MPTPAYLTIKGSQQGLISAGALGPESVGTAWQQGREDQIMVQALSHEIFVKAKNSGHRTHLPLVITKALDKSSPLLNNALCRAEVLDICQLDVYRISAQGAQELFYAIELEDAVITRIEFDMPNCLDPAFAQLTPMEKIYISYRYIKWGHEAGNTFSSDEWLRGGASKESLLSRAIERQQKAQRERKDYGQIIKVTNSETGKPAINRGCIVTAEGKSWETSTDEYGEIEIKTSDINSEISIHVNYEAPTGEYSDYRKKAND